MPLKKFVPAQIATALSEAQAEPVVVSLPPVLSEPVIVASPVSQPKYTGRKLQTDDDKMTKADWAAKDRRIGRAGLYQAALQSVGLMQYAPTIEEYFALVERAADKGLEWVNKAAQ